MLHSITFGGYYYIGTQLTSHLVPGEYRSSGQAVYGLTWGVYPALSQAYSAAGCSRIWMPPYCTGFVAGERSADLSVSFGYGIRSGRRRSR
ncbi:hypothetical protein [Paenibacillus azoreducens]|uniref:hypothetical protein n=1 Tax=Paenibacillus azoreducens TaxID=116718 RepID=UPI001BB332B1|nr:hypothetical protein [Paenibacillus azoreducens]